MVYSSISITFIAGLIMLLFLKNINVLLLTLLSIIIFYAQHRIKTITQIICFEKFDNLRALASAIYSSIMFLSIFISHEILVLLNITGINTIFCGAIVGSLIMFAATRKLTTKVLE